MSEIETSVEVNTDVVFKWLGYHNVYMFPNKADFEKCDFANSEELASNDQNPFTFKATSPGTFYFGCKVGNGWHCRQPQKLALKVTGKLYACIDSVEPYCQFFIFFHTRSGCVGIMRLRRELYSRHLIFILCDIIILSFSEWFRGYALAHSRCAIVGI